MSSNNTKTFRILYTNQLRKKAPSYKDGFLKYNVDTKSLTILDDKNNKVEQTFVSHCDGLSNVENGEEFTTKSLKIQIEDEISSLAAATTSTPTTTSSSSNNNYNNNSNSSFSSSQQTKPSAQPRTTPTTITRTTTTTGRKPFKTPFKENFDTSKKNNEQQEVNNPKPVSRLTPSPMFQQQQAATSFGSNTVRRAPPAVQQQELDDEFLLEDDELDLGDFDVPSTKPAVTSKFFKTDSSTTISQNSRMTSQGLNSTNSSYKSASQVAPKHQQQANQQQKNSNISTQSNLNNNNNRYNPPPQQPKYTTPQIYDEEDDETFDFTELEFEKETSGHSSTASFLKSKFENNHQNKPTRALYKPPSFEQEEKEVLYNEDEFILEDDDIQPPPQQRPPVNSNLTNRSVNGGQQSVSKPTPVQPHNQFNKPKIDLLIDDDDFEDGLISLPEETKPNRPTIQPQANVPKKTTPSVNNVNTTNSSFQSASRIVQKPKPTPQLDLSLENLDVDSDEDLKLDSPPKFKKPTFNPPTQVSKPPQKSTPKPSQPNKRQLLMDDDDGDDDTAFATPQAPSSLSSIKSNSSTTTTFTPPQRFVPPSPSSVTSSASSSTSSQYSTPNSLPSQKFTPTRISPNKKFKQTQLSMGQKESPKATYSQSSNTNEIPILSLVQKLKRTKHEIIFPDMEMNDLYEQNNTHPKRCIEVPNKFTSIDHYKAVFLDAIFEEMNLQMFNLANNFYKTYRKITQTGSMTGAPKNDNAPNCKCGLKAKLKIVKKDGPNKGKPFYGCGKPTMNDTCQFFSWANNVHPSFVTNSRNGFLENKTGDFDRMSFFRRNGIHFYFGCDLVKQTFGSARKKTSVTQWFLQIENKEKSTVYAKDDIWILSKSKDFQFKTGHIVIAKSVFHGPDKDGKVELEIISGLGDNLEQETVFAIRGPNFSTELEMIENLTELDPLKLPLLTEILGTTEEESLELFRKRLKTKFKPIQKSSTEEDDESKGENEENQDASLDPQAISFELEMDSDEMHNTAKSFIEEYKLNEDQANLIYRCAKWFEKGDISSPICLVHGVFGAGKTTLLIVLILFMCRILDEADNSSVRILIASVTNVAVDNILEGLITENYKNLVRVGSQKKIAKSVLPYTVSSDNISVKDQIKSLQDMLKDKDIDPDEEAGIKLAIKDLKSGVYENRKQSIKDARVVGVTCAATGFEVLKNQKFSILILDESSQCLEPLALLPLTRFGCMKFVAVGDPLQLPPTLTGSRSGENKEDSLEKTIFIRLSNIGCEPHLLRTQYRCHPKISRITNELFYDNKLVDGITEDDREPLIPGMPPVLVVDCENGTETMENNSYKNELETKSIIHFIQLLLQNGIAHEDIGVIALYKTQETYLKTQFITNNLKAVKVSTVDAFQGGEKNIVFVSTSRTSEYGLAFIEQKQRLNVALSRARNHLVIVGKMKTLLKGSYWSKVIGHAQRIKGSVWLSDTILANNDFDFLSKFKHCYHPINKPSKQVLLDDDEEDINDSILSEDILPLKPKEKNKHLEKLSAVTDRRHKHKIEVDEDEMEYDFEEDSKPVNQSNKGTSLAAEDNEYQFSDEEIDFNAADEIMKDMEETSSSKRKIDQISLEEPKVQDNIDYTPKKKKLSTGSEVEIIEDEFDLMPTPEKDTSSTNLEKDSSFNEPIQTLKPTINFSQLNADIKLTQDNTKTDEGKKNTPQEIDFDDLSYLDDL